MLRNYFKQLHLLFQRAELFRYDRRLPFEFVGTAGPIVGRSIDATAFSMRCADPGDPEIFFFLSEF